MNTPFRLVVLSLLLSLVICGRALASDKPLIVFEGKKKATNKQGITTSVITSKTIEMHRLQNKIDFIDNVVVEREDTSFLADKMVVYYKQNKSDKTLFQERTKGKKGGESKIKKIDALNNVKIFQEDFVATGDIGSYDPIAGIFIVEKNVIFNTGTSTANGDKFIYDINTKKGYLIGRKDYITKQKNGKSDEEQQPKDHRVTVIIDENDEAIKKQKKENNKDLKNE
jgi:lipopolysaccharide export system protein LptA